jgi:hypothetical protein
MTDPTRKEINDVLEQLDKPEWRSDADRLGLPLATTTSGSGAPKLDVDATLRRTTPNHIGKK